MLNTLLVRMVKCKDEFRDVDGLNIRLTFCLPGIASCGEKYSGKPVLRTDSSEYQFCSVSQVTIRHQHCICFDSI